MTNPLPTVGGDDGTWGTKLNAYLSKAVLGPVLNVKDYGALGDGSTDDTTAIQAAIDVATGSNFCSVYLPKGTYKITASIVIPVTYHLRVIGEGREITIINQYTAGQKVFKFSGDNTHSVHMSDFTAKYNSQQTNAESVAFEYGVAGGSSSGFYHHVYERLFVQNSYRAFALDDNDGVQTLWNSTWRDIIITATKNSAFWFFPATPIGIPINKFFNIGIFNTGGGPVPTGPAFRFNAVEAIIYGADVEGWYDDVIWFDGGGYCNVEGLHVEHHVFDDASSRMVYASDGPLAIDGFNIEGSTTANNTTAVQIIKPDTGSKITLRNGQHNVTTTLGTATVKEVCHNTVGTNVEVEIVGVIKNGGGLNQMGLGTNSQTTSSFLINNGFSNLTYSATIATTNQSASTFAIVATNGTAFTISNPTTPVCGRRITYDIKNSSGGALGVITWGSEFLTAGAFTNPANTKRRTISFYYDGTSWIEVSRAAADI